MALVSHNCGLCLAHSLHDAYSLIGDLSHRGMEATGFMAVGDSIDVLKYVGPPGSKGLFDIDGLHSIFPAHKYHTFAAHVRYASMGRKDQILEDAHPHVIGGEIDNRGNHILIRNCDSAMLHNGQIDQRFLGTYEGLRTGCDTEALLHHFKMLGPEGVLRTVPGAYTLIVADKRRKDVIVLRDASGIKPGVMGIKDGKAVVASEDIAIRKSGARYKFDLLPGAAYYMAPDGSYTYEVLVEPNLRKCFFEWNYLAHLDTVLGRISVRVVRESLGEQLVEEFCPEDIDFVTYLPRSPEVAAEAFAKKRGLPFVPVFYKLDGTRSFQGSTADEREDSINHNLFLSPQIAGMDSLDYLRGKVALIIDDSIVRGNNSRRAIELIRSTGVKKVYFASYTPPIGIIGEDGEPRGCKSGVDMPLDDDFIARGRDVSEIASKLRVDGLGYLSLEGMISVYERLGISGDNLCTFCVGGAEPF
ncbi:hypothetical protein HOD38_00595 [archaeon]|jgi:amidophosphoribosyltransferase|nr:hypothetical protein [archaeon]MBT4396745.1 hypothetical protein [archaeon]MBT4441355.1 hypothetical protein [archaeon]